MNASKRNFFRQNPKRRQALIGLRRLGSAKMILKTKHFSMLRISRRMNLVDAKMGAISIKLERETPCRLAATRCTHIDVVAFVHRLDRTGAPRITAFSLRIDRMHFPLTREIQPPTSLDLNATCEMRGREGIERYLCVYLCVCGSVVPRGSGC